MASKQHKRFAGEYSKPVNSFQILPREQNCSGDTKSIRLMKDGDEGGGRGREKPHPPRNDSGFFFRHNQPKIWLMGRNKLHIWTRVWSQRGNLKQQLDFSGSDVASGSNAPSAVEGIHTTAGPNLFLREKDFCPQNIARLKGYLLGFISGVKWPPWPSDHSWKVRRFIIIKSPYGYITRQNI